MLYSAELGIQGFFAAWQAPSEEISIWDRIRGFLVWASAGLEEWFGVPLQIFETDPQRWRLRHEQRILALA